MMKIGKETEQIEFKKSTSELSNALIDIVAILNKHSSGTLYFGVSNDGEPHKFDIGKDTERDISRKIHEAIKPSIYPTIQVKKVNGVSIIKVSFNGKQAPYSCLGRYYIRVADESRELSPDELARYFFSANYTSWEKAMTNETINDVDDAALKDFLKKSIESKRIPNQKFNKKLLLTQLSLLYDDKHLNNAGRLLFSKKKPIEIKLAVFATNEKTTFIDINPLKGNIYNLINEAEKYVKSHINWSVKIKGFNREDVPEIPVLALREIIVNSFAHADYTLNSVNEIDIYPNRIAIYNPGAFPNEYTPDDYARRDLSSKIRNELICNVLYKCKNIEKWGTGIKKTYQLCKKSRVDIDYEKEPKGFWFIFNRKNVTTNVTTNVTLKLSKIEKNVLAQIKSNPYVTRDELAKLVKRKSRQVQRILNSLKAKNIISREESKKTGYWHVL